DSRRKNAPAVFLFSVASQVRKQGSHRSGCFDEKRRNDRTPASFPGSYANRGNEAREIRDDDSTALTQESSCNLTAAFFFARLEFALYKRQRMC
ncbi:MAG: hypothetical protein IKX47_00755, partial [Oscillospiraceae bacterium]|nr:hypothetical protein [Oscillospiraceae bacterium]